MNHPASLALRILALVAGVAMGGCATSPPAQHYALAPLDNSANPADRANAAQTRVVNPAAVRIVIGPVDIPALVDRSQLVVRRTGYRVEILESERWAEPLRDAVPRLLAARLSRQLDQAWVMQFGDPLAGRAQIGVAVDIVDLELRPDIEALVAAQWTLRRVTPAGAVAAAGLAGSIDPVPSQPGCACASASDASGSADPLAPPGTVTGTVVARVPAAAGTEALVAALATALDQVADDLSRRLRAMPGVEPSTP